MPTPNILTKLKGIDLTKIKERQKQYEASFEAIPVTDPWVPLKLKDQEFRLEFSYFAAQQIQRALGKNIFAGEIGPTELSNMETLVILIVCGLQVHHEGIAEDDVSKLITLKHRMYYANVLQRAMEAIQPDFDSLESIIGDINEMTSQLKDLEAGDTTAPLPEIVLSPTFGEPADL